MSRTGVLERQLSMDSALERVAADGWADRARDAVLRFARSGEAFTIETVRDAVGNPPGSGNACGALLKSMAAAKLIVEAGSARAQRPDARGRKVTVWRGR